MGSFTMPADFNFTPSTAVARTNPGGYQNSLGTACMDSPADLSPPCPRESVSISNEDSRQSSSTGGGSDLVGGLMGAFGSGPAEAADKAKDQGAKAEASKGDAGKSAAK